MSDDKGQQEPSMEDILASIRRILSEDEVEDAPKPAKAAPAAPPPPPPVEEEEEDVLELTDDMVAEEEPADDGEPEIDLAAWGLAEEVDEPEPEPEPPPPPPRAAAPPPAYQPPPMAELEEDEEEGEPWVSSPVAEASTAALSELARAVARERMVGLGARGMTLEDLVRDIMKPILKEWLDQNLPYMIERIVRKEIERMVNRAEKF